MLYTTKTSVGDSWKEISLLKYNKGLGGNIFKKKKKLFQALEYIRGHLFFYYTSPLDGQRVKATQTSRKLASQHTKSFKKSRKANMFLFTIFCDPNLIIMFYYFLIL